MTTLLRRAHPDTVLVLHNLLDTLEDPGPLDRGFARHLIEQIDDILGEIGRPRRSGSAQPQRAAALVDEVTVLPPGAV